MWAVHPPRSLRCRVYPRTPSTVRPLADSKNEGGSGTEEGVAGEYPSKLPSDASRATPEIAFPFASTASMERKVAVLEKSTDAEVGAPG